MTDQKVSQKIVPLETPEEEKKEQTQRQTAEQIEIEIGIGLEKQEKQEYNNRVVKPRRNKIDVKRDFFDKLKITIKFFTMIFPTIFGLFDFALDINYVFISGNFENSDISYAAQFCFWLAPFISLIAWLLLFTSDIRSQPCKGFQQYKKKYNNALLEQKSNSNNNSFKVCYMFQAYLYQFGYEIYHMCYFFPKGLFFTLLQSLKILVVYIYRFTGYKPSYLITKSVLKEFEKNSKILKNNHKLHMQNLEIRKQNEKKEDKNKQEKEKYEKAQEQIKLYQSRDWVNQEDLILTIQESLYIPKYRKIQEEHKMGQFQTPSKQVQLESGIQNKSTENSLCFGVEFMESVSQDSVLQSFLLIGDLIESAFESLPMLILQFINNGFTGWEFWDKVSFASSGIMVIISLTKIVSMLFDYKLNAAFEIFSLLTEKTNGKKEEEKDEIQLKDWIVGGQEQECSLQEGTGWFVGDWGCQELIIGDIDELEILSKWGQDQFCQYEVVSFDFSNQQESISLLTKEKFKNYFEIIAQNVAQNNTLSFNFYMTSLSPQDKLDIYAFFGETQMSGYLFQEQFETVGMEEIIMKQIANQFNNNNGDNNNKIRNLKIIFNEQHVIQYSGYQKIDSQVQEGFVDCLRVNLPHIQNHFEIENLIFSQENLQCLFQDIKEFPQDISHISLNCETLNEKQILLFRNLPNLERLKLIQRKGEIEDIKELLSNTPKLRDIELNLQENKVTNIDQFSENLLNNHKNLEKIVIDFTLNEITNIDKLSEKLANNNNPDLQYLSMNLAKNEITCIDKLGEGLGSNDTLTEFSMDLLFGKISSIDKIGEGIGNNRKLKKFGLNMKNCKISNIDILAAGLGRNKNISHFNMDLQQNQIANIDKLGEAFGNNNCLTNFSLNLDQNQISSIEQLGEGIGRNTSLMDIYMNLSRNQITSLDKFGDGIGKNTSLKYLNMDLLRNCIPNLDKLGEGIGNNKTIETLSMNLFMNEINNIDKLGEGIGKNTQLKVFNMDIQKNKIFNIDTLGKGIGLNRRLENFEINLLGNQVKNIDFLAKGLGNNSCLDRFVVNLEENQIESVDELEDGIGRNVGLKQFSMEIANNKIGSVDGVAEGIGRNKVLENFSMNLCNNRINNIDKLGEGLGNNQKLSEFRINFDKNQIGSLEAIGEGLCKNSALGVFDMRLEENKVSNIDKIGEGIGRNRSLNYFKMDLFMNQIDNVDMIGEGIGRNDKLEDFDMILVMNKITNIEKITEGLDRNGKLANFQLMLQENQIEDKQKQNLQQIVQDKTQIGKKLKIGF